MEVEESVSSWLIEGSPPQSPCLPVSAPTCLWATFAVLDLSVVDQQVLVCHQSFSEEEEDEEHLIGQAHQADHSPWLEPRGYFLGKTGQEP